MCGFTLNDGDTETAFTLWPHDMRSREYKASGVVKEARVENRRWFKGYVNNDKNEVARLTIDGNTIEGLYYNKGKAIAIEPLSHYIKTSRPGEHVIYKVSEIEGAVMKCDASGVSALQRTDGAARSGSTPGETRPRLIQIATDATYSYYQLYGADTNDHILSILNVVEGLYERDFGITFRVTFQHYFTGESDPYTGDGQELLSQFQDNWNRNWPDVPRHIAFLFHGKLLDSGVLGRAYQANFTPLSNFIGYTSPILASGVAPVDPFFNQSNYNRTTPAASTYYRGARRVVDDNGWYLTAGWVNWQPEIMPYPFDGSF